MTTIGAFKANFINGFRPNLYEMMIVGMPESMKFFCKTIQIPNKEINIIEVPYLNMKYKIAGDTSFDLLNTTILMDTDFQIRNAVESWMLRTRSNGAMFGGTPSDYQSTAYLKVMSSTGEYIAEYEFDNIWPASMSAVELAFEANDTIAEFSVAWAYSSWQKVL